MKAQSPSLHADAPTATVLAPQPWEQAIRLECVQPKDSLASLQGRLNQSVVLAGRQGYEVVAAALGKLGTQDCVVVTYRRPLKP